MNMYRWRGSGGERSLRQNGKSPNTLGLQYHNKVMVQPQALTISFIEKEGFKPTLKRGGAVFLLDPNMKVVPQKRSLIMEGSAFHSAFEDSRNHKEACIRVEQYSTG